MKQEIKSGLIQSGGVMSGVGLRLNHEGNGNIWSGMTKMFGENTTLAVEAALKGSIMLLILAVVLLVSYIIINRIIYCLRLTFATAALITTCIVNVPGLISFMILMKLNALKVRELILSKSDLDDGCEEYKIIDSQLKIASEKFVKLEQKAKVIHTTINTKIRTLKRIA